MATYIVNVNDPTSPTNDQGAKQGAEELRALKLKIQQLVAGALIVSATGANSADLTCLIAPDDKDHTSLLAGGWLPWNLNQQWGGAGCTPHNMIDGASGTEYKFEPFDGYIEDDTNVSVGDNAARFYQYQVITPARNLNLNAIWAKFYKTLNPTDNLTLKLWTVAAGVPSVLQATANVVSGKFITSNTDGGWYRFSFAAVFALVAGTQYIITAEKSGGVDAANFYNWKSKAAQTHYPNNLAGVGTAAPVWTAGNTASRCFIVEATSASNVIQAGGIFLGKMVGSEGNPINRSVAYCRPLADFFPLFNPNGWSVLFRGNSLTAGKPVWSAVYGSHHDKIDVRVQLGTNTLIVRMYNSDGTVTTLNGTSDVTTATHKDIMLVGRTIGDGGDYLKIYTGTGGVWAKESEVIGQTFILDSLMQKLGTAWLMGGMALIPLANYTKFNSMNVLPSADGYTYAGAATEGLVFAVTGNRLAQISAGNAGAQDGFYSKAAAGLVNATGWSMYTRGRVVKNTNTKDALGCAIRVRDGTKDSYLTFQEYYAESFNTTLGYIPQVDTKTFDSTYLFAGKGSDVLVFRNGRLLVDGIGQSTVASGVNQIDFGDLSAVAGENADAIWNYFGRFDTGYHAPTFTSGELHEFAVWSGDKSALGSTLYNVGSPISVKQYCGIENNFIGPRYSYQFKVDGVTSAPTTALATYGIINDMEGFVIGGMLKQTCSCTHGHSVANGSNTLVGAIDGSFEDARHSRESDMSIANTRVEASLRRTDIVYFGLHKIDIRWKTASGANAVAVLRNRTMEVEVQL